MKNFTIFQFLSCLLSKKKEIIKKFQRIVIKTSIFETIVVLIMRKNFLVFIKKRWKLRNFREKKYLQNDVEASLKETNAVL